MQDTLVFLNELLRSSLSLHVAFGIGTEIQDADFAQDADLGIKTVGSNFCMQVVVYLFTTTVVR
jgi:hypothetical protein